MFSTLQRPTLEELERRRAMRETFSPPRSSTLQRRESVLSRGFNALFRDGYASVDFSFIWELPFNP